MNPAKSPFTSIRIFSKTTQIKPMKTKPSILLSGMFAALVMVAAPSATAQIQTTGTPGSPSATTTIDGKQLSDPPPTEFGGMIKETAPGLQALLAADGRAAQGRAQRAADHDRRPGLRRHQHLRRRHPDAGHGSPREGGLALHAVPLHRALLADARGADHRPQPPLGRASA